MVSLLIMKTQAASKKCSPDDKIKQLIYLVIVHPPELDLPVVGPGHDERHGGVEGGPVDTPVVTLQHMLHHRVSLIRGNTA